MMAMEIERAPLIDRLPPVKGSYEENALLKKLTWFRVGGAAEVLYRPAEVQDLVAFLTRRPSDVPVTILGVGSNVLVRDGGISGVVIRLGRSFATVAIEGELVRAGAGAPDVSVALTARDAGVGGLEFLRGVPGTIGGALRMNAGAYGREIADVLVEAKAINLNGVERTFSPDEFGFAYRHSKIGADWIFTEATLRGRRDDPAAIAARMEEISEARVESQPVKSRTGGSTFKNPPGRKAWELIDQAGCRGLRIGGAHISEQHCNFLINDGDASAADLEALGEKARMRVKQATGVDLEWEIKIVGEPLSDGKAG